MTCPPCTHDCNEGRNCPTGKGNNMTKEALAQTQEPVAWQFFQNGKWHNCMEVNDHRKHTEAVGVPVRDLYTTPPQRTWVGLDEVEIVGCTCECIDVGEFNMSCAIDFARAIEAKLKEKNT